MKVNIHIERIILNGISIPYHQQEPFQAAIEMELQRLFAAYGPGDSLMASGALSQLTGSDIQLTAENDPNVLGRQIGKVVYEGINR